MIDLYSSIISFIGVTCISTYLVALAYKNTKFVLKHKVRYDLNVFVIKRVLYNLAYDRCFCFPIMDLGVKA
jgi:Translocon-associated protein, gamma subunit (TRAP-gamma).